MKKSGVLAMALAAGPAQATSSAAHDVYHLVGWSPQAVAVEVLSVSPGSRDGRAAVVLDQDRLLVLGRNGDQRPSALALDLQFIDRHENVRHRLPLHDALALLKREGVEVHLNPDEADPLAPDFQPLEADDRCSPPPGAGVAVRGLCAPDGQRVLLVTEGNLSAAPTT